MVYHRKEIGYLTKEKEELQEKVDLLEARIEQRHLQVSIICALTDLQVIFLVSGRTDWLGKLHVDRGSGRLRGPGSVLEISLRGSETLASKNDS